MVASLTWLSKMKWLDTLRDKRETCLRSRSCKIPVCRWAGVGFGLEVDSGLRRHKFWVLEAMTHEGIFPVNRIRRATYGWCYLIGGDDGLVHILSPTRYNYILATKDMYIRGTEVVLLWNNIINKGEYKCYNCILVLWSVSLVASSLYWPTNYTDQRTTLHHRHHDTFEGKYPLPSDSIPSLHSKKASFLAPHAMTDRSSEDVRQECQLLRSVHLSRSRLLDTAGSATEHRVCWRLVDHSDS